MDPIGLVCFFEGMMHMGVSKNNGTPKSSILINHPFGDTPILGNIHIESETNPSLNFYHPEN